MKNYLLFILGVLAMQIQTANAQNKVLVVLSAENKITLKDGVVHPTGFFLSELMVPVKALLAAGYKPVFVTPNGVRPTMDMVSDSAFWFQGNDSEYQEIKRLYASLPEIQEPLKLADVAKAGLTEFAGVFVPGGHAPMEDLLVDADLGRILQYFHAAGKPTALICHGPIALLSSLPDAKAYVNALVNGQNVAADFPWIKSWIYQGYKMTSFSTKEEKQEEPGQDNALGGYVLFYPDEALGKAGGTVLVNALNWQSNVVRDRELITGQNPLSDQALARVFVGALNENQ